MNLARRMFDHVTPRERVDRRNVKQELARRETDRPSYSSYWAWTLVALVCLFVVPDNLRLRYERAERETQYAEEIGRLQQQAALCRPTEPVCREHPVHMEGWTVTHCIKNPIQL